MAENDLELGAEWAAAAAAGPGPSADQMLDLSEGYARMLAAERGSKAHLDAAGHRTLAEEREARRRESGTSDTRT